MLKRLRNLCILYVCLYIAIFNAVPASAADTVADPTLEELQALLEKGLSVYEIDQEVSRLTAKETQIAGEIAKTEKDTAKQEELVALKRQHAGKVLRAYYMGERDSLWMVILTIRSLNDALIVLEYLNLIIENDHRVLNAYLHSFQELKKLHAQLVETQTRLKDIKAQFLAQRARAVALQKELDEQLAKRPEAKQQIDEFVDAWKKKGIPVFRNYLQALSSAMTDLPNYIITSKDNLDIDNDKGIWTVHISDEELNQYARKQNELFKSFAFQFTNEGITISGKQGDVSAVIKGNYFIPDNETNIIKFAITELVFNGAKLPDTTIKSLEEQFDLGFHMTEVKEGFFSFSFTPLAVKMDGNKLIVELKLN